MRAHQELETIVGGVMWLSAEMQLLAAVFGFGRRSRFDVDVDGLPSLGPSLSRRPQEVGGGDGRTRASDRVHV